MAYFLKDLFVSFLAVLGLCCCMQSFSSCSKWEFIFIVVHGLLIAMASLVAVHGFWGIWASVVVVHGLSCSMWDPSRPGIKLKSPASAGRFLTTSHQEALIAYILKCFHMSNTKVQNYCGQD